MLLTNIKNYFQDLLQIKYSCFKNPIFLLICMSFKNLEEETSFCSKSLNFIAWPNLKIWFCFNWLFLIKSSNHNIKKQPFPQTIGDQKFWKLSGIIFENWNISNKFENWVEFERISKAIFSIFKKACIFTELLVIIWIMTTCWLKQEKQSRIIFHSSSLEIQKLKLQRDRVGVGGTGRYREKEHINNF